MAERTLIIAEPGSTHEGQLDAMLELIVVAAASGADAYKSQWVSDPERLCARRHATEYLESYRKIAFPLEWHSALREACRALNLQYGSSVYLPGDVGLLTGYCDFLKISSFEMRDQELVDAATATGLRVFMSTGMSDDENDRPSYAWQDDERSHEDRRLFLLGCTSAYPAPLAELRLRDRRLDGYSDHSKDVRVGAWAVCAGAQIIETHVRLDACDATNSDYAVALTPLEFQRYVRNIRDAELALGDGRKRVTASEQSMLQYCVR